MGLRSFAELHSAARLACDRSSFDAGHRRNRFAVAGTKAVAAAMFLALLLDYRPDTDIFVVVLLWLTFLVWHSMRLDWEYGRVVATELRLGMLREIDAFCRPYEALLGGQSYRVMLATEERADLQRHMRRLADARNTIRFARVLRSVKHEYRQAVRAAARMEKIHTMRIVVRASAS